MPVILAGGNGFIGKNLYRKLSPDQDIKVFDISVDREDDRHIRGNISDQRILDTVIHENDTVVCLAGCGGGPAASGKELIKEINTDVEQTVSFFEYCGKRHIKKLIFASSGGAVYGAAGQRAVNENTVPCPISSYGIIKLTLEYYLDLISRSYGYSGISLRISNPYGYMQKPFSGQGIIAAYLAGASLGRTLEIWGNGSNVRDYIYINDVTEAFEKVIKKEISGDVFNIGTGIGTSIKELAGLVQKQFPETEIKVEYKNNVETEADYNVLDCTKAKEKIGWEAKTCLSDGLCRMFQMWNADEGQFSGNVKQSETDL